MVVKALPHAVLTGALLCAGWAVLWAGPACRLMARQPIRATSPWRRQRQQLHLQAAEAAADLVAIVAVDAAMAIVAMLLPQQQQGRQQRDPGQPRLLCCVTRCGSRRARKARTTWHRHDNGSCLDITQR